VATLLGGVDRADFDRLRLWVPLRAAGLDDWQLLRTRLAIGLARPSKAADPRRLAEAWLADPDLRAYLRINESEGAEWFGEEAFESLLQLATDLERAAGARRAPPAIAQLRAAAEKARFRVDRTLDALGRRPARGGRPGRAAGSPSRCRPPTRPRDDA